MQFLLFTSLQSRWSMNVNDTYLPLVDSIDEEVPSLSIHDLRRKRTLSP